MRFGSINSLIFVQVHYKENFLIFYFPKMKKILFLITFCFFSQTSFSAILITRDTIPRQTHRLTKQQIIETKAWDDTSQAMVQYYFSRNKKAKRGVGIFTGVGLLFAYAFDRIIMGDSGGGGGAILLALIIGIPLAGLIFYSALLVLLYTFYWIRFSRPQLIKQLAMYNNGNGLPNRIKRRKEFLNFLKIAKLSGAIK
jgi:hypothetical protein